MARRATLSEEDFKVIMEHARIAASMPVCGLGEDLNNLSFNIDDSLPSLMTVLGKKAKPENSALPSSGTHPISSRIPVSIIRAFKAQAARHGRNYQTAMIQALREAAARSV